MQKQQFIEWNILFILDTKLIRLRRLLTRYLLIILKVKGHEIEV